jgi:hypothetical protein
MMRMTGLPARWPWQRLDNPFRRPMRSMIFDTASLLVRCATRTKSANLRGEWSRRSGANGRPADYELSTSESQWTHADARARFTEQPLDGGARMNGVSRRAFLTTTGAAAGALASPAVARASRHGADLSRAWPRTEPPRGRDLLSGGLRRWTHEATGDRQRVFRRVSAGRGRGPLASGRSRTGLPPVPSARKWRPSVQRRREGRNSGPSETKFCRSSTSPSCPSWVDRQY